MTPNAQPSAAERYWDACNGGELLYERCLECGCVNTYPRGFCAKCGSENTAWERSALLGTVYSAATVLLAPSPELRDIAPYGLFLANIDEGFRIMAHGESGLTVGTKIRVEFRNLGDKALPYLRAL
jgi:uncharacterized protein